MECSHNSYPLKMKDAYVVSVHIGALLNQPLHDLDLIYLSCNI